MSDAQRAMTAAEGEAPVNPYSLLEAVNDSSDTVHTGWLIFIGIMSYLLVAVAGVTHKDLLLSRDIPLPLLQVPIELTRFFLFAPIVLVLFHVGIVTQLVMLARKALELDRALQILESTDRRTHPLRLELHNFFFVQAIAGPERSRIVNGLLHGLTWLTLVVLPVVLLLYVQISFLPYHDITITWAHRIALVADIAMLGLIGVFLTRTEQSLIGALFRASLDHPITSVMTIAVLGAVALFSFLIATVPGEKLDRMGRSLLGQGPASLSQGPAAYGFVLPFRWHRADGRLFGIFERNLNVTDQDLVIDKDVTPGEPTLNLRKRDLRYARLDRTDIHQADMTGANLDGASLVGADLRSVSLHCADVNTLLLGDDRRAANCPSARGANFTKARMNEASLAGLDLTGARLEEADLAGARAPYTVMVGANFYSAHLERVDLTGGIAMQGTNFGTASMQGADLTGAKLHGADLTSAGLQGATLEFASLQGAALTDADLEGASLFQAALAGADLSGATVAAASLREAWIWLARPPPLAKSALVDLSGVRGAPASKAEVEALEAMLRGIADPGLEARIRKSIGPVLAGEAGAPLTEADRAAARGWADLIASQGRDTGPTSSTSALAPVSAASASVAVSPGSGNATATGTPPATGREPPRGLAARLTWHLGNLACKVRWAEGSVATGLARRVLGVAFTGDVVAFYERVHVPTCPASLNMSPATLKSLAARADSLQSR